MDWKKLKKISGRPTKKQKAAEERTKPTGIAKVAKRAYKYQEKIQKFKEKING